MCIYSERIPLERPSFFTGAVSVGIDRAVFCVHVRRVFFFIRSTRYRHGFSHGFDTSFYTFTACMHVYTAVKRHDPLNDERRGDVAVTPVRTSRRRPRSRLPCSARPSRVKNTRDAVKTKPYRPPAGRPSSCADRSPKRCRRGVRRPGIRHQGTSAPSAPSSSSYSSAPSCNSQVNRIVYFPSAREITSRV